MVRFYRYFGVQNKLSTETKLYGPIYMKDAFLLLFDLFFIVLCNKFFYNCKSKVPQAIYDIMAAYIGIYSIIRPRSNPGKRNIELLRMTITPTIHFYQSISTGHYIKMSDDFILNPKTCGRLELSYADVAGGEE